MLSVRDLTIGRPGADTDAPVVEAIDLEIGPGETLGLTGPSGSGKTATALALLGLGLDGGPSKATGSIVFRGRDLLGLTPGQWRAIRGVGIALVPQDPASSLTPVRRIGDLLSEVVSAHLPGAKNRGEVANLLREVGFPDPDDVACRFPHELSGGMQQRVAIAAALAGEPALLIADEPTSSLDVIATRQVMDLLVEIKRQRSMAMLLISHDRRELASRANRVIELRGDRLTDHPPGFDPVGACSRVPRKPGSKRVDRARPGDRPILELEDVCVTFAGRHRSKAVAALRGVTLEIGAGQAIGLVGVTGSGKSTLARCTTALIEPTAGRVRIEGEDLAELPRRRLRARLTSIGMVFQNPASSLNPRRRAGSAIEAPLRARGVRSAAERRQLVEGAARSVRLDEALLDRLPAELSGGQQQRVALARALVTSPELLILDEPFTALDRELEDELSRLLAGFRADRGLAMLLITHDMRLVSRMTDRVAVMAEGRIVEQGATDRVIAAPVEPITARLVEAAFDR